MSVIADPCHPGWTWEAYPLDWHEDSMNGLCPYGCVLYAAIEGDELRIQHGENPEHSRFFTLDELNDVGGCTFLPNPVSNWFEEIHAYQRVMQKGLDFTYANRTGAGMDEAGL